MRYLTKSRFKLASECPRKLYYAAHEDQYPNRKTEDDFLQALAEGGHQVGALAQCYFPGGVLVASLDYDDAVAHTNELLAREDVIVYEAAIRHGEFFLRVDILVKHGNDVDLIEVKAKSYDPATTVFFNKRTPQWLTTDWCQYLDDVAFQTWVTREARPEWRIHPFLMLVDKSRTSDVEGLHQLFRISRVNGRAQIELTDEPTANRIGRHLLAMVDVNAEVNALIAGTAIDATKDPRNGRPLAARAEQYAAIYRADERYRAGISSTCKKCEFRTTEQDLASGKKSGYHECWREQLGVQFDVDAPHVFDIWSARKIDQWLNSGTYRMEDVPLADLNARQALQVDVSTGRLQGPEVIAPELSAVMGRWEFPLHFVDFETIMPAIPFHLGMHPYQNLAFQFSCHHLESDGRVTHDQWLHNDAGQFPNWEFLRALRSSLGDTGSIFRYAEHENTILDHLRSQLMSRCRPVPGDLNIEEYCTWIGTVMKGGSRAMIDMCDLVRKYYYHARMRGSNSIKAVLAAVLKDSEHLRELYSRPLAFGTNLTGLIMWTREGTSGDVADPYKLLPPLFADVDPGGIALLESDDEIREGGAAMTAWARMQFCQMGDTEREAIKSGLLRYCELDTLAMLMIYQHWASRTC